METNPDTPQTVEDAFHLLRAGQSAAAERLCRDLVERNPDHADALHLLGGIAHKENRTDDAVDYFTRALAIQPDNPIFLTNMGAAELARGNPAQALEILQRAVALRTDLAPAYEQLGCALFALDRWDEAMEAFDQALSIDPNYARAHRQLANRLKAGGRISQAAAHLRQVLSANPNDVTALLDFAALMQDGQFSTRAMSYLKRVLDIQPTHPRAHALLGESYADIGMTRRAVLHLKRAIALQPRLVQPYVTLASILSGIGRIDEATGLLERVLDVAPKNGGANFQLAQIKDLDPDGPEIARIQALVDDPKKPSELKGRLHLAMGRTFDAAKRYDEAFRHFGDGNTLIGNSLKTRGIGYNHDGETRLVETLKRTFTPELFEAFKGRGLETDVPVFIAGMPRSGTTLGEQVIASHPKAFGAGELMDIPYLTRILPHMAGGVPYPNCMNKVSSESLVKLATAYLKRIQDLSGNAQRVTNKLPGNFMTLGLIALLFPNAPLVHCRRNAVDTCLSCFIAAFNQGHPYCFDLEDLGKHWRNYRTIMDHWETVLGDRLFVQDYQVMVEDPEAQTRRLLAHCGLEWDAQCMAFYDTKRPVKTASKTQIRQPIYTTSVERWRHYADYLGPLFDALGPFAPSR